MPVYFGLNGLFRFKKEMLFMKKIAIAISVCILTLFISSCSAVDKSKFIGEYELSKAEGVGISLSQEQIDSMKAIGLTATLEIKDDGTAVMDIFGEKLNLTYDLRKMTFTYEGKDEKFTFDGSRVAFNNEGRSLEFTKVK